MNIPNIAIFGIAYGFALGTGFMAVISSLLGSNFILFLFSMVALWGALYATSDFFYDVKRKWMNLYK